MSSSRFRRYWPLFLIPLIIVLAGAYVALKQPAYNPHMAARSAHVAKAKKTIQPLVTDTDYGTLANNGITKTITTTGTEKAIWHFYYDASAAGVNARDFGIAMSYNKSSAHYTPEAIVTNPTGSVVADCVTSSLNTACAGVTTSKWTETGEYEVQAYNSQGSAYPTLSGTFNLYTGIASQPFTAAGPYGGGSMYPDVSYPGSLVGGFQTLWHFESTASSTQSVTVTMNNTNGVSGALMYIIAYSPNGGYKVADSYTTATDTFHPGVAGTYTIRAFNAQSSYTSLTPIPFTLKVSGPTVTLPTAAKADGAWCEQCYLASLAAGNTGGKSAGDPINVATGNVFQSVTDYSTVGQNPLAFTRYYNSMSVSRNLYPTLMGVNWRTNFDRYLRILSSSQVAAERPDGQVINFTSSGSWAPDSDEDYTLTSSGSTWTLTNHNDTVETYTDSSGKGTLDSITWRDGYKQTLNYSSAGELSSVSDSYGRDLGFSYNSAGLLSEVTTPDSLTLDYGYISFTSSDLLDTVTYNTSPSTKRTYLYEDTDTLPYALTGITDENGNRYATWSYDVSGRATMSELAGGANEEQVTYSSTGNYTVTGPLGIEDTYHFTTSQNLPKVTEIDRAANGSVGSATESMSYDSSGYISKLTDWNGNVTTWTNDSHGDPTEIIYASGNTYAQTTDITYDSTWVRLPKTITTDGVTAHLSYDSSGNLTSRELEDTTTQSIPYSTNGQTRTWQFTYTSTGLLTSAQLPRTDVTAKTTYGYTGGVLTSIEDAASHTTTVNSYQAGGLPKTVTDPNGARTTFTYNNRNWMTGTELFTSAGDYTTDLEYDSDGNLTKETLPDNSYLSYSYDSAGRLTKIENALSETKNITLNAMGEPTQTLWKTSGGTTKRETDATYDALGRMKTSKGGENQTTSYTYDDNGNVLTITDPLNNVTTQTFDALNRLLTTKNELNEESSFTYDKHNRLLTASDPRSNETSYVYDGFGDRIQTSSPDSGTTVYYYDKDANVTEKLDANNYETDMTYDDLDRILTRHYPADSSENVDFTYDESGHGYGVGHLTSVTDAAGSLSQSWNQRGFLSSSTRTISSNNYETDWSYGSAGRLSGITYASAGWLVSYSRDDAGQISSITTTQPGHSAVNVATSVTHLPFGPVSSFTFGNGVTDTRTYDNDYRLTGIEDKGSSDIYYISAGYNAGNDITSVTDHVTAANDQTLEYDSAGRLSYASSGSYTAGTISYDSAGNRTAYGSTTYTISSSSNQLTNDGTNSITYTSAGNMSAIGSDSYSYNKANQLSSATVSGTTSNYVYGVFGNRLKVTVGAGTPVIQTYGQDGALLSEIQGSSSETDYVYLDGFPVAAIDATGANIYALHTDWLGTPWKATNSSKTVVWSGAYEPFGKISPTGSITQNLRFPGQYSDATGFYHNGFRDYIPAYGRYVESDPIGIAGGLNTYTYVGNNPYMWTDPLGLYTASVTGGFSLPVSPWVSTGPSGGGFEIYNSNNGWTLTPVQPRQEVEIGNTAGIGYQLSVEGLNGASSQCEGSTINLSPDFMGKYFGGSITLRSSPNLSLPWYSPERYIYGYSINFGLALPWPLGSAVTISSPLNSPSSP